MKSCAKCKEFKSLDSFRIKSDGYLYSYCKLCSKKTQYKWRTENPTRISKINRKQTLKRYSGMTQEEYNNLLDSQNGGCGICGRLAGTKNLAVDHCHSTNKIRGILCGTCNNAIGALGDNLDGLKRALKYLEK